MFKDYDKSHFLTARLKMVEQLREQIKDDMVMEAIARVPRECFVPEDERYLAYQDIALPIGFDQTISQPYIVALMTQALCLTGNEKVLEIGTGSGYQAAILSRLARQVITTERIPQLVQNARLVLDNLGCDNVEVQLAEEILGWQKESPYDAIIVTAAAPRLPAELIAQLTLGGRLVIPIGSFHLQELFRITKKQSQNVIEKLVDCHFVPLIGKGAWEG